MFGRPSQSTKVEPPKQDAKKQEKASALFAGIGSGKKNDSSDDSDSEKKKKKKEKKKAKESAQAASEEPKVDLLSLDTGNQPVTQPTSSTGDVMNLLDFNEPSSQP